MPHGTQAEIFIETLSEMLTEERARKAARALRQARAQADRFLSRSFGDDMDGQSPPGRLIDRASTAFEQTL